MDLRKLIEDYLREAKLMQLATSVEGRPWICSVWFSFDEDLSIYWFSSTTRRHSKELLKNNHVAAAIAIPQSPQHPPRGLQLEGVAELLTEQNDIDKAITTYEGRIFSRETMQVFMDSTEKPHRFYRIKPTKYILFDAVNFPDEARQEYTL